MDVPFFIYKDGGIMAQQGHKQREESVYQQLKGITSEAKARLLMFKYGLKCNEEVTIDSIRKHFSSIKFTDVEELYRKYSTEQDYQMAEKHIIKLLHGQKLIELYNIYFDRARTDTQAFKQFCDFSEKFFSDEKESGLVALLNGIELGDDDE